MTRYTRARHDAIIDGLIDGTDSAERVALATKAEAARVERVNAKAARMVKAATVREAAKRVEREAADGATPAGSRCSVCGYKCGCYSEVPESNDPRWLTWSTMPASKFSAGKWVQIGAWQENDRADRCRPPATTCRVGQR